MGKREDLKADILRKQLAQRIKAGMSISKAAKDVGCSYAHAKNIAAQLD